MIQDVALRFRALTQIQRRKYFLITITQIFLSFLDLVGIALMGALGAIAIRGIQTKPTGESVNRLLSILQLNSFDFQVQVIVLSLLALLFLTAKSILSLFLTRKIYSFLANCSAQLSESLATKFLRRDISVINLRNSSEYHHILGGGISTLTVGVLGLISSIVADVSLLVIVGLGILIVDPFIAFTTLFLFSAVGGLLYSGMSKYSKINGRKILEFSIASNRAITESIQTFRESHVRNRTNYFIGRISSLKYDYSNALAAQSLMPNISKYIFEVSLVFGGLIVATLQFLTQDSSRAVASLIVFLAAGSRIAPALLRVQQNMVQLHANIESSRTAMEFIYEKTRKPDNEKSDEFARETFKVDSGIEIEDLSYVYPSAFSPAISDLSMRISPGSMVAIVGKSGSGKSTLVDILLGLLTPTQGNILIHGLRPRDFIERFPGAIGYVPQNIGFIDGSLRANISLSDESYTDEELMGALINASLLEFANLGPSGLDYQVGEAGTRLSGGQKQRVGIARAMLTNPKIVVLDEATSALDAATESLVSETIGKLKGNCMVIVIAHRLSTVINSDLVVYLDRGKLIHYGTFSQVREAIPNFDQQASLLGL